MALNLRSISRAVALLSLVSSFAALSARAQTYDYDSSGAPIAQATPDPKTLYVDDTNLVKALKKYVVVINHPTKIFHWFNASGRNSVWTSKLSAGNSAGYDHLTNGAQRYFQAFCTNDSLRDPADCVRGDSSINFGSGNMYGPGLYASTDPIATRSYGGGSNWVLLQIELPKGFRMASLVWQINDDQLPQSAMDELDKMGCSNYDFKSRTSGSYLLNLVLPYGNTVISSRPQPGTSEQKCALNLRRLLKDHLKIEGLYYGYGATSFSQCSSSVPNGPSGQMANGAGLHQGAFVIANPARIKTSSVKVFNSQSTDASADRVAIQSLFYQSQSQSSSQSEDHALTMAVQSYYGTNGIPDYPDYKVYAWYMKGCSAYLHPGAVNYVQACGDWYQICDNAYNNCKIVPLSPPPNWKPGQSYVSKISSQDAPGGILWPDLDGHDQDPKVAKWIEKNLLGCLDIAPFGVTPNMRHHRFFPKPSKPLDDED